MYEKLTEEKHSEILEAGICEFAARGMDRTSMSAIAKRAGISVGVMYKYYRDKETFFLACVRRSISRLEQAFSEVFRQEGSLLEYVDRIIRILQRHAENHGDDIRLYCAIVSGRQKNYTATLAEEIEQKTAALYTRVIAAAQKDRTVRPDIDPGMWAFFFDNLLMMLQFSCCCDYYRERWKYYCTDEVLQDHDYVRKEMLKFLESAFSFTTAGSEAKM